MTHGTVPEGTHYNRLLMSLTLPRFYAQLQKHRDAQKLTSILLETGGELPEDERAAVQLVAFEDGGRTFPYAPAPPTRSLFLSVRRSREV